MLTRHIAAALMMALCLTGCANNVEPTAGPAAAPGPSASDFVDLPSTKARSGADPSGKPGTSGTTTITGMMAAGVEPGCLLLQDASGTHLLLFEDPAMRADVQAGSKVTVTGRSDPSMMSTCQQGTPFIVTAVRAG